MILNDEFEDLKFDKRLHFLLETSRKVSKEI